MHVCAVLLCLVVCLTLLASFFLPSHLSLKHVCTFNIIHVASISKHHVMRSSRVSPSFPLRGSKVTLQFVCVEGESQAIYMYTAIYSSTECQYGSDTDIPVRRKCHQATYTFLIEFPIETTTINHTYTNTCTCSSCTMAACGLWYTRVALIL